LIIVDKIKFSYLAGIIDGEGCINVSVNNTKAYCLQVRISQKNKKDLILLQKEYGGKIYVNSNTKNYQLHWLGKNSELILRNIFPFLKWKKDEAELAIAFISQIMIGKKGRYGEKQNRKLAKFIKEQLSAIKRRKYA